MPRWVPVIAEGCPGYRLLDSGHGRKLEEVSGWRLIRPEPSAIWPPRLDESAWAQYDAACTLDRSRSKGTAPYYAWDMERGMAAHENYLAVLGIEAIIRLRPGNKHIGIFPEQFAHWKQLAEIGHSWTGGRRPRLLNLFGYTGVASLVAARAGFDVTHIDASKPTLAWLRENMQHNDLPNIRNIQEDAAKFAERELRRGHTYEAVLLDPPKRGSGPGGELWESRTSLKTVFETCAALLSERARLLVMTTYNTVLSPLALRNLGESVLSQKDGKTLAGEIAVPHADDDRLLPMSLFLSWEGP